MEDEYDGTVTVTHIRPPLCLKLTEYELNEAQRLIERYKPTINIEEDCAPSEPYWWEIRSCSIGTSVYLHIKGVNKKFHLTDLDSF